jgi:hypothetical protein
VNLVLGAEAEDLLIQQRQVRRDHERHQIVIHRWGWTLVVNPDGTTSAWNKNKTKVLHSHGPPARAG